jgi:hypothetical protein
MKNKNGKMDNRVFIGFCLTATVRAHAVQTIHFNIENKIYPGNGVSIDANGVKIIRSRG